MGTKPTIARRLAAGLGVAALALTLTGCWHGTGTVIRRDYHASWTSVTTSCSSTGKVTSCHPNITTYPESYDLLVRDSKGDEHWVSVSPGDYNSHPVGSTFTNG